VQALDKEIKHLYGQWTVAEGTALQVLNASRSAGIVSATLNSTGNYTIVLDDAYPALYTVGALYDFGTAALTTGSFVQLWEDNVADSTKKSIIIQFVRMDTGVAAAVPDGVVIRFHAVLKNSNSSAVGAGFLT
jgi:hypothetical protein